MKLYIELPWPPSVNRYWRTPRTGKLAGRTMISEEGRDYRTAVVAQLHGTLPTSKRLAVEIEAHPPDKRRRDLDNIAKAPLDALAHAGVYADDCQIDDLRIIRRGVAKDGYLAVWITELE